MASVRRQIFDAIEAKLELVREALDWMTVLRDPSLPVGQDQMNALVLATGGEPEPGSLTGFVGTYMADFSVGFTVLERESASAEDLLDAGFVAVCDALLDPTDMQLGGLIVGVQRGAVSPAFTGPGLNSGGRIVGVQSIDFSAAYWGREGDASAPGP